MLNGKKILFIAPRFFGYEKLIAENLARQGALVDYYNDRPGSDFLTKAMIRIDRRLLARRTNAYYDSIIEATKGRDYDHVLIVRGEAIASSRLNALRRENPKAKFYLYLWDSMNYNPNAKAIHQLFDQVWSFDREDANNHGKIAFLPLFYSEAFATTRFPATEYEYDACFIGTVHTDRYQVIEKIVTDLRERGYKVFLHCYYPSRILFRLRSLIDTGFRRFSKKYIQFESIPLDRIVDYFDRSKVIIDVNRPAQLGLTMRTVEALGARRKLITTNADIINYDLYAKENILIVDRNNPIMSDDFFQSNVTQFDENIWKDYSVHQWIEKIFLHHEPQLRT